MGVACSEPQGPPGVLYGEPINLLRPVSHRLLERFAVQPFGVLGSSLPSPAPGTAIDAVIVDTAQPQEVLENRPYAAKGSSQSIYTWLGISDNTSAFPAPVHNHFSDAGKNSVEGLATYHHYRQGQHVIHVVVPALKDLDQSIRVLIETYARVLGEFCKAIGPEPDEAATRTWSGSAPKRLRIPPISDVGVLSKELLPQMGRIFWSAMAIALERLPAALQRRLQTAVVEVCSFQGQHVKVFQDALCEKWGNGGLRLGPDEGQLCSFAGSHDWVRQRNGPRDRFLRLGAAMATLRAVWEQGYVLNGGRGVGLNYINRMLEGSRIILADPASTKIDPSDEPGERRVIQVHAPLDEGMSVVERVLQLARGGTPTAAINIVSSHSDHQGGGIFTGDRHADEEEWYMTSTLLKSVQHAHFMEEASSRASGQQATRGLALPADGCLLSPLVEIFRDSARNGYTFLAQPVTLHGVITLSIDDRKDDRDLLRQRLAVAFKAAAACGAQVLVCSCMNLAFAGDDNAAVAAGTSFGEVLRQLATPPPLQEVALAGEHLFGEAVRCAVQQEPPPMPSEAISPPLTPTNLQISQEISLEAGAVMRSESRTRLSRTPRHDSSAFFDRHYTEIREIGKGAFGRVLLVRENATQEERVCKVVPVGGMDARMADMLRREAELLSSLDHPNIVRLYEWAEDVASKQIVMILEYIPGGGCDELLAMSMGVRLSEGLVARIMRQSLTALAYCHAQEIVHRDIKPENIMLTARPIWRHPGAKLIDFGAAAPEGFKPSDVVGTVEYMAPEVVRGEACSTKADIWAAAAAAFELLTGEPPFGACDNQSAVAERKRRGGDKVDASDPIQKRILAYTSFEDLQPHAQQWPKWQCSTRYWERLSLEAQDFLRWLLQPSPQHRPTAVEALQHPWFEAHRPEPAKLNEEMALSIVNYFRAPKLLQCCMLLVAGAGSIHQVDLEEAGLVFLTADSDCDGKLSYKELTNALKMAELDGNSYGNDKADASALDAASNPELLEGLGFTGFLAACLFSRQASMQQLLADAFCALDGDRDGWVSAEEAADFFQESGVPELSSRPQSQALSLQSWCASLEAHIGGQQQPNMESTDGPMAANFRRPPEPALRVHRRGPKRGCC